MAGSSSSSPETNCSRLNQQLKDFGYRGHPVANWTFNYQQLVPLLSWLHSGSLVAPSVDNFRRFASLDTSSIIKGHDLDQAMDAMHSFSRAGKAATRRSQLAQRRKELGDIKRETRCLADQKAYLKQQIKSLRQKHEMYTKPHKSESNLHLRDTLTLKSRCVDAQNLIRHSLAEDSAIMSLNANISKSMEQFLRRVSDDHGKAISQKICELSKMYECQKKASLKSINGTQISQKYATQLRLAFVTNREITEYSLRRTYLLQAISKAKQQPRDNSGTVDDINVSRIEHLKRYANSLNQWIATSRSEMNCVMNSLERYYSLPFLIVDLNLILSVLHPKTEMQDEIIRALLRNFSSLKLCIISFAQQHIIRKYANDLVYAMYFHLTELAGEPSNYESYRETTRRINKSSGKQNELCAALTLGGKACSANCRCRICFVDVINQTKPINEQTSLSNRRELKFLTDDMISLKAQLNDERLKEVSKSSNAKIPLIYSLERAFSSFESNLIYLLNSEDEEKMRLQSQFEV